MPGKEGCAVDDAALIRALRKRQRRALHKLIDRYTGYVTTVACQTLGEQMRREDLEEIVSDVFLALWQHADALQPERPLRPYLAAIARHRAVDYLRAAAPALPLEEAVCAAAQAGPEEAAERAETRDALSAAVRALPEPERTLCIGYYYEGRPLKEIAARLGLRESTAKTRLYRARQTLKKQLMKGGVDHA